MAGVDGGDVVRVNLHLAITHLVVLVLQAVAVVPALCVARACPAEMSRAE